MTPQQQAHKASTRHEPLARVCLRAGKSLVPGWVFSEDDPPRVVRVGADPECEWQVVAAGVAPEVLRFAWREGNLYFRVNPGVGVRVNGTRAGDGVWLAANDGMRLDAGATSFDVAIEHDQHVDFDETATQRIGTFDRLPLAENDAGSAEPSMHPPAPAVLEVSATPVQDVSATPVQAVSATPVQAVSTTAVQAVSTTAVQAVDVHDAETSDRAFADLTPYAHEPSVEWEPVALEHTEVVQDGKAVSGVREPARMPPSVGRVIGDTVLEVPRPSVPRAYEAQVVMPDGREVPVPVAQENARAVPHEPVVIPPHEMSRSPQRAIPQEGPATPRERPTAEFFEREPIAFGAPLHGPRTERKLKSAPSPFDDEEDTLVVLSPPMLWPNSRTIRRVVLTAVVCGLAYVGWVQLLDAI